MGTMWGCSRPAAIRDSWTNRSAAFADAASWRSTTFTATSRCSALSFARNTTAKPPSPSSSPTVNSLPSAAWRRFRRAAWVLRMADGKARNRRRAALGLALLAGVWLFGVWPPPFWWRDHWPRETAMMRRADGRAGGQAGAEFRPARPPYRPTALEEISPILQRLVILAEDSRFRSHPGVDWAELKDAVGVAPDAGFWATARGAWRGRDRIR